MRSIAATNSGLSSTVTSRWIVPTALRSARFVVWGQNTLRLFDGLNDQIAISLHDSASVTPLLANPGPAGHDPAFHQSEW